MALLRLLRSVVGLLAGSPPALQVFRVQPTLAAVKRWKQTVSRWEKA